MAIVFKKHSFYLLGVILIIIGVVLYFKISAHQNQEEIVAAVASYGTVTETVSVSGFVESKHTAGLTFPVTGIVTEVFVDEGDIVEAGEVLATLAATKLVADRNDALAALSIAQAQYQEATSGPREETIAVANQSISNAMQNLARVKIEYAEKTENARKALYSNGLEAISNNVNEKATPPSISGTYTCDSVGEYQINVYSSGAKSGYSYRLEGIEKTTAAASTEQPAPLGSCGLYIQFNSFSQYSGSSWVIQIPNTKSSTYNTYKNAYDLAIVQEKNAINAAIDMLALAEEEASLTTASARPEVIAQKRGSINQAQARIAAIDAQIADRSIVAPFVGMVTDVSILPGETAPTIPVITMLADGSFELVARIPEIDITKLSINQKVEAVFDANPNDIITGTIDFISPLATEIDGVAYFEATVLLDNTPEWLRAGLNADIEIITKEVENVLRLPKRFVTIKEQNKGSVLLLNTETETTTEVDVEVLFIGNDGYIAITGIEEGAVVSAP